MSSLAYLTKRSIANKVKKALHRPVTYIAIVAIIAYAVLMLFSFGMMAKDSGHNDPQSLATILSILIFFTMPSDVISYSRRKGLVFRPSDIHFLFPAPENPKKILIRASLRNYIALAGIAIVAGVFGVLNYKVAVWRMLLYVLFYGVLENILEGAMIIFCYGNERLSERFFKVLTVILYAFMAIFVLVAVYMIYNADSGFLAISQYLSNPLVQMVPFVGWAIACVQLIVVGPTTVSAICSALYLISVIALFVMAYKMKCSGEYYEDAMKFADEFETKRRKAKKGEVVLGSGKKKYVKNASVEYKGVYAKAIFYRQLLEYKKNRFFIFGWNTLICLGIGIAIAVIGTKGSIMQEAGEFRVFIIPGVIAYMLFIFSGYATKWSKELENPYTYLIPDNGFRKLWYATAIEHIRSFVDGCLITIPGAIAMGLSPAVTILTVLIYICLVGNKLYLNMLSEAILGNTLGATGKTILRTFLQGIAITFGVLAAVLAGAFLNITAGFAAMILVTVIITLAAAIGASTAFDRMESYD